MSGLRIPWRASRRAVIRVSSAAIAETSPRTRSARALTSSRLPIGVATTKSLLISPSGAARHLPMNGEDNSSSPVLEPLPYSVGHLGSGTDVAGGRRQHLEEGLAVVAAQDAVVEDDDRSAVGRPPDQAPEALLQTQRRLRQRQLRERIAHLLRPGGEDGIGRHRERQADDDHAAQALAGDVDSFPERRRAQEQRPFRLLERLEELPPLAVDTLAEDEHLVQVDALLERRMHVAQLPVRGEQRQRAPTDPPRDGRDGPLNRGTERP